MQDIIEFTWHKNKPGNIVMIELEIFELEKMFDVAQTAGDEIIHADNLAAFFDETVAEVGAEKARCTCNQDSLHELICLFAPDAEVTKTFLTHVLRVI